jgi:hypothetical protein
MTYEYGFRCLLKVVRIQNEILEELLSDYAGRWWHDKLVDAKETLSELPKVESDGS